MDNFNSEYIRSVINPKIHSYYPDSDQTTSHLKSITLTNNLTCLKSTFLLVHRPLCKNNNQILSLYVPDVVRGGFTFCSYIAPDEDLSENYSRVRPVSGILRAISTTISPSITFSVSGVINAADVQTLPNTRRLSYSQIPSFRRNQLDVVTNSVAIGVVSLLHPQGQNPFQIIESNTSENTDSFLLLTAFYPSGTEAMVDGWIFAGPQAYWKRMEVDLGDIPADMQGFVEFEFSFDFLDEVTVLAVPFVSVVITTLGKDFGDWSTDRLNLFSSAMANANNAQPANGFYAVLRIYCEDPIHHLTIVGPIGLDPINIRNIRWTFRSLEYYQLGAREPATLIGVDGVTPFQENVPGTTFTLSGLYNYEAVPDSSLARQLTTSTRRTPESVFVIPAFMNMMIRGDVRFLWPLNQYDMAVESLSLKVSSPEKVASASGILDILKAIGKAIVPVVSGVASTLSPQLGDIVTSIGDAALTSGLYRRGNTAGIYRPLPQNPLNPASRTGFSKSVIDSKFLAALGTFKYTNSELIVEEDMGMIRPTVPKMKTGKNWPSLIASSTKANLQIAMERGVVKQLEFQYVGNRFPMILGTNNSTHGIVYASGAPFAGSKYQIVNYSFSYDNVPYQGEVMISTGGVTFDDEALFSICSAHCSALRPEVYLTYDVDHVSKVSGSSLGLATFETYLRKAGTNLMTGAVTPDHEVYAPTGLDEKIKYAKSVGLPLITPGDDEERKTIVEAIVGITPYVTSNGELNMGDVTYGGYYPGVYLCDTMAAVSLSLIFTKTDKVLAWSEVQDYAVEFVAITDPTTQEVQEQMRPVSHTERIPEDVDWDDIADDVEFIGESGFSAPLLEQNILSELRSGRQTKKVVSIYNTYQTLYNARELARANKEEALQSLELESWDDVVPEYERLLGTEANALMQNKPVTSLVRWQAYPLLGIIKSARQYLAKPARQEKVKPKMSFAVRQVSGKVLAPQKSIKGGTLVQAPKPVSKPIIPTSSTKIIGKTKPQQQTKLLSIAPPKTSTLFKEEVTDPSELIEESEEEEDSGEELQVQLPTKPTQKTTKMQARPKTDMEIMMESMKNMTSMVTALSNNMASISTTLSSNVETTNKLVDEIAQIKSAKAPSKPPVSRKVIGKH